MPTYEYECDGCGHRFEVFQSITDSPLRKCRACGALKLRRLIGTGGAIIFKGSGFYTTDYRSDDYKKKAAAEKPPTAADAPSDGKKPPDTEKGGKPDKS